MVTVHSIDESFMGKKVMWDPAHKNESWVSCMYSYVYFFSLLSALRPLHNDKLPVDRYLLYFTLYINCDRRYRYK